MAKYPYTVKYNGRYYAAGGDVPEKEAANKAASNSDERRKPANTNRLPREKDE